MISASGKQTIKLVETDNMFRRYGLNQLKDVIARKRKQGLTIPIDENQINLWLSKRIGSVANNLESDRRSM